MTDTATATTAPARAGIVRSGLLSMAALAALGVTRLLHGVLVSHATDRETYGLVGTLIAVTTIASLLLPAGVASAASRYIPFHHGRADPAAARGADRVLARAGLAGGALLALGAAAGATAAFHLGAVDAAQVAALCFAFCVYSVQKAILYGYGLVPAYTRLELAGSAVSLLATAAVVAAGSRLYLLPLATGYALFAAGGWWALRPARRGQRRPPALAERRDIAAYVGLACLGTFCSMGFLQGTQLLAQRFTAPAEVAYFAAAVTLVAPAYFLPRALGLVLFPAMARAHGAGDLADVRRQADLSTRALLALPAPAFAAALVLAPQVLSVYGGAGYAEGAPVLRLILAATYLAVVAVPAVNALSSGEHVRIPVLCAVAGCLTGLGVVAALGGPLGARGVALGYLAGTVVTAGGPVVIAWRRHGLHWTGPAGRALAVLAGGLLLAPLGSGLPAPAAITAALAAGALSAAILRPDLATLLAAARAARAR
ncbi:lipopolysaccharide biosynthesis protein [Rhizomonospora bruguierae]|uniref:lipopolysaccharide biosynthesis protein n=1 Tax=Rhizomonospora bruguierae TaxID=1581705 RepID=UPI001BCC7C83|nr:lipopolysaccharide biosynthesis protein [Micromonospora sp. NBRC 107566]